MNKKLQAKKIEDAKLIIDDMKDERINIMRSFMGKYIDDDMIEKLRNLNFFITPASIHHHGKYEGALFDHSYTVAKALVNLTEKLGLQWELERSPYIVGMFHDLCKLDNYIRSDDGSWDYNTNILVSGHGEKSVIMLQQFMNLTEEEIYCIRWHMGAFDDKENWNVYGKACTMYPNVLFTHTADMIAARIKGI